MRPEFDIDDYYIKTCRWASYISRDGPQVGDWVYFADGTERRISYIWDVEGKDIDIQTSDGGSFYLGENYMTFSGSLYMAVPFATLKLREGETRAAPVWFFHHDSWRAYNGVYTGIDCKIWDCSLPAPEV